MIFFDGGLLSHTKYRELVETDGKLNSQVLNTARLRWGLFVWQRRTNEWNYEKRPQSSFYPRLSIFWI